jgi:hypothetical protein
MKAVVGATPCASGHCLLYCESVADETAWATDALQFFVG